MMSKVCVSSVPVLTFSPDILLAAQGIRVLLLDVDGVLTQGQLLYGAEGEVLKSFHTLDGHGLKMLQASGIEVAIVSGRDSAALRQRLAALGITHAACGVQDKVPVAERILGELGADWSQAAVMGDDWPDLPLLLRAGFAAAPANAHAEVRARAHYITQAIGGGGAVREVCDVLLQAAGRYAEMLATYCSYGECAMAPHDGVACGGAFGGALDGQ